AQGVGIRGDVLAYAEVGRERAWRCRQLTAKDLAQPEGVQILRAQAQDTGQHHVLLRADTGLHDEIDLPARLPALLVQAEQTPQLQERHVRLRVLPVDDDGYIGRAHSGRDEDERRNGQSPGAHVRT